MATRRDQPALATWMASVLEPLVAELRLSRERIEVLADERAQFRTERDAALARLEGLTASHGPGASNLTPVTPDPTTGSSLDPPAAWMDGGGGHAAGDRRRGRAAGVGGVSPEDAYRALLVYGGAVMLLFVLLLAVVAWLRRPGRGRDRYD